jgi:hypothetical protein
MGMDIDVLYLDKDGVVLCCDNALESFRFSCIKGAVTMVKLLTGATKGINEGNQILMVFPHC